MSKETKKIIQDVMKSVKTELSTLYRVVEENEKAKIDEDDFEDGQISYDDLYKCLVKMIEWTHQVQSKIEKNSLSPKMYSKEFASIKFALTRQSGHTDFAERLFKFKFNNALYLTADESILAYAKNYRFNKYKTMEPEELARMGTISQISKGRLKGTKPDAIIIDCASLFSKKDIEIIYDEFSQIAYNQEKFIFLFLE